MLCKTTIVFTLYSVLLTIVSARLKKVPCNNNDEQCLTKSTRAIFPIIVAGRPGVESSDPLFMEEIVAQEPDIKLVLRNAKMTGLLKCTVKKVVVMSEKLFFTYYIWCPSLTVESNYEAEGVLDGKPFNGKGTSNITFANYDIWLKGNYEKFEKAGDLHTQMTQFDIELHADNVVRNVTGLHFEDKILDLDDASKKGISELEIRTRKSIMYSFLKKYVNNINTFLKVVPVKDIHYELVEE